MSFNELFVYITFVVGFALTPGPNMMLYLTYTFEYGRKAGWATAAGIVSSFLVHITAIVFGLTALLVSMPNALEILRYCGIAYLLYLAITNLKIVKWKAGDAQQTEAGLGVFYLKGFIGNLLNPGALFLYFSVLPQFLHPERGQLLLQNVKLGGIQMLCSFITNCTIVYLAGFATEAFFKNERYQRIVRYCMSFFIILFAVKMLFMKF
ncbi:MAG: LysE family translocator [Chitinophagaceae bacterium]|nr:LysE family translocator [Chitinophagaceae bacterium]